MRKYQMLVNKKQEHNEEGQTLHYKLEGNIALEHLHEIETQLEDMITKLKNDRTQRWRSWIEHSWGQQRKPYTNGSEERPVMDHSQLVMEEVRK
eukprot:10882184-Heterocapsa_arctica.AAC.1